MIGERYWSTGIIIERRGPDWSVGLKFYDNGFAQEGCTEGTLRVRYLTPDLEAAVDLLKGDAERLGIEWQGDPTVYAGDQDAEDLQAPANAQAERIGWRPIYSRAPSVGASA